MPSTSLGHSRSASATIPSLYRIALLYLEPLFALGGTILVLTDPHTYASTMTRNAISSVPSHTNFVYTQLAGGWLHFAFTEAMVLRFVDDLRVWRLLCIGMLLSDIAFCHSVAQAVGGWANWLVISDWTREDWASTITTWPFVLTRIAIVLGIGLNDQDARFTSRKSE